MYRPYGKHVPFRTWWDAYEKIVREAGGRPHWAKVSWFLLYLIIIAHSFLFPDVHRLIQ
jgi:hypothetical protein